MLVSFASVVSVITVLPLLLAALMAIRLPVAASALLSERHAPPSVSCHAQMHLASLPNMLLPVSKHRIEYHMLPRTLSSLRRRSFSLWRLSLVRSRSLDLSFSLCRPSAGSLPSPSACSLSRTSSWPDAEGSATAAADSGGAGTSPGGQDVKRQYH